ncbi:MAG: hypothetical protein MZV65_29235 [Chromatiales bacterium]|nr:hypothetical protein [Chromatiales bacterium]
MSRADEPAGFNEAVNEDWELQPSRRRRPRGFRSMERVGIARRWPGFYEVTPDHHPILGRSRTSPGSI